MARVGGNHKLDPVDAKGRETLPPIGNYLDGKLALGHGQLGHALADPAGQRLGVTAAALAQRLGCGEEGLARLGELSLHPLETRLVGADASQLFGQPLMMQSQLGRFDVVLAGQRDGARQPGLELDKPLGIELEIIQIAA